MSLNAFLSQNVKKGKEVEFVASDRFVDEDGNVVPFKLRPVSGEVDEGLRKECTKQGIDENGRPKVEFDSHLYARKFTAASVSYPNLLSQELQDSYGVMTPEDLLPKMLYSGEYLKLQAEVQKVNGFKTFQELENEAKN